MLIASLTSVYVLQLTKNMSKGVLPLNLVSLIFSSAEEFVNAFDRRSNTLRYETRAQMSEGDPVVLEVQMPLLPGPVLLRADVSQAGEIKEFKIHKGHRSDCAYLLNVATGRRGADAPRVHARYPAKIAVSCRVDRADGSSNNFDTEIEDLSAGGAFVRCPRSPQKGTRLRMVVGPVAGQEYLVYGEVAWARKGQGFGVRFTAAPSGPSLRAVIRRSAETGRLAFAA
jgi:hypothetical protein